MNKSSVVLTIALAAALAACKEPSGDVAAPGQAQTAQNPQAGAPVVPAPVGVKPVPADELLPPGPLSIKVVNEYCNIESVNDSIYQDSSPKTVARDRVVDVAGWAVDKANDRLPERLALIVERIDLGARWQVSGMQTVPRRDVADYNGFAAGLVDSGFEAQLDLRDFEPGTYHLFIVHDVDGEVVGCDNSRQIVLQ